MKLSELKEGDKLAICNISGEFLRISKVARKTDRALWTAQSAIGERFDFSGKSLNGKRTTCRVPTKDDDKKHDGQKERARREAARRKAAKVCEEAEEYRLAQKIGYELCDADHGGPANYLEFAKRIGLEKLQAFMDVVERAK